MRRSPHAVCVWSGTGCTLQSARRLAGTPATAFLLETLDRLSVWQAVDAVAAALGTPRPAVSALLAGLHALDLVDVAAASAAPASASAEPAVPEGDAWRAWPPVARLFHLGTRDVAFGAAARDASSPPVPERPATVLPDQGDAHVALPMPVLHGSLRRALHLRRTHRRFEPAPLTAQALGTLLGVTFGVQAWASTGDEPPLALKTSPSGGARHSLEAYVWVRRVAGVPEALYHYRPDRHVLTRLTPGTPPPSVLAWLPAQPGFEDASVVIAMASVLSRVAWRYRSARAYRVILIEAGHLAQTFCLCAAALDLAPFCTAALADSEIERSLGLDGDTRPVCYVVGAGTPVLGPWRPHAGPRAPEMDVTRLGAALGRD